MLTPIPEFDGLLTIGFAVAALVAYVYLPRELPDIAYLVGLLIMLVASVVTPGPVYKSGGLPYYVLWFGAALGFAAILTKLEQGTFGEWA